MQGAEDVKGEVDWDMCDTARYNELVAVSAEEHGDPGEVPRRQCKAGGLCADTWGGCWGLVDSGGDGLTWWIGVYESGKPTRCGRDEGSSSTYAFQWDQLLLLQTAEFVETLV